MVTTFYPPFNFGGDGIFVHRLANALARRGHHVDVIHCRDAYQLSAGTEVTTGYDNHPNITVHGLKSNWGFLSPLATQQTGHPVFKSTQLNTLIQRQFDVIHFHNISLVGGPAVMARGAGIKLYTLHDYWLICPTHVMFKFNRSACTKRRCYACGLAHKRPPQWWRHSTLLEKAARNIDAFITPSRFAGDLHRQFGFDVPFVHLPNFVPAIAGVPPPPNTRDEGSKKPYFLFVGRLERLKGLQTIIPLFRDYDKAQLWIAGTGKDERKMRRLAAGSSNIRFLGYVSGTEELQALYRQTRAVIVPSLCYEVFPLVLLEAFQQQTPVITRNIGAMPDVVAESGGGLTYDTPHDLIAAMDLLLDDQSRRDEFGKRGHDTYRQRWTTEAHLQRYLGLIQERMRARPLFDHPHDANG